MHTYVSSQTLTFDVTEYGPTDGNLDVQVISTYSNVELIYLTYTYNGTYLYTSQDEGQDLVVNNTNIRLMENITTPVATSQEFDMTVNRCAAINGEITLTMSVLHTDNTRGQPSASINVQGLL